MAQKRVLSEQEKVELILKRAGVTFDSKKAQAQIALNTRCKRCGRTLSSLERVVFENKCVTCMTEETKQKRDRFVQKYIIIAFAFIASLIIGAYCASSAASSKTWQIVGTVISCVSIGVSLVFVFYTNMDKMFPRIPAKAQIWCCFIVALIVVFIMCMLIVMVKSWIIFFIIMLAVGAYLAYIAYGEYNVINEKYNLIEVYKRKSRDKEYVESITEALETRASDVIDDVNPNEGEGEPQPAEEDKNEPVQNIDKFNVIRKQDNVSAGPAVSTENGAERSDSESAQTVAEKSEDSGDFSI